MKGSPMPISRQYPLPLLQPLTTTNPLSVSVDLLALEFSFKWNHVGFVPLYLISFTEDVLMVLPGCSLCQSIIPFYGRRVFHSVYGPHFVYPFNFHGYFGLFPHLDYCDVCCSKSLFNPKGPRDLKWEGIWSPKPGTVGRDSSGG